jgi:hypothetical protein
MNGDGFADVIVGAPSYATDGGRAYVYLGAAAGLGSAPTRVLDAPEFSGGRFGCAVAMAGDVNGDGLADFVVGSSKAGTGGRAYVYLGGSAGLPSAPATMLSGPVADSFFGASVASAGDVNGDGFGDIVVGAQKAGAGGRAYVYLGSASGISTTVAATLVGPTAGTDFGVSVAAAGDVNADGFADIIVGAFSGTGYAYVFLGSSSGVVTTPAVTMDAPEASGRFGLAARSAGDVNADGFSDVLVGADSVSLGDGRAYLYLGRATGPAATPSLNISAPDSGGSFGASVAGEMDVNGDGYADVVIGASTFGGTGRSYVFLGGSTGLAATPAATLSAPDAGGGFGGAIGGSDLTGDGFADVVVGAANVSSGVGRAYVYVGGSGAFATTPSKTLTGPDAGGHFGTTVANAIGAFRRRRFCAH